MSQPKKRKRVAEFVGYIPVTSHMREHGFMYADPTHNVRGSDAYSIPERMVVPEEIATDTHHYDVRFAYEGDVRPAFMFDASVSVDQADHYNDFWQRFEPSKLLYFYCTPCTSKKSCDCLASASRYYHCHWDTECNVWRRVRDDEQSLAERSRTLHRCHLIHVKHDNPLFNLSYQPVQEEERDEEYWRHKYDVEWSIEWSIDGLTQLWRSLLAGHRQSVECESFEQRQRETGERGPRNRHGRNGTETRYERDCEWGAIRGGYYSTGMNGINHKFYSIEAGEAERRGAHALAADMIDSSKDWPGWRTVRIEGPGAFAGGKFSIELYGGRRDDNEPGGILDRLDRGSATLMIPART